MRLSLPESPFIRIAVPLIAGIALYNCANLPTPAPALILLIPAIMLYVMVNAIKNLSIRYKINGLYPIIFFCLYVSAGWILAYANRPPTLNKELLNHKLFLVADIKSIEHKNVTTDIISECNIGAISSAHHHIARQRLQTTAGRPHLLPFRNRANQIINRPGSVRLRFIYEA